MLRNKSKERTVDSLNELSASYEEMAKALNETVSELQNTRHLWGKPYSKQGRPKLIKLGWALITIPVPMMGVKKTLGTLLITAGLVQEKLRRLHVADVYNTLREVSKGMQETNL